MQQNLPKRRVHMLMKTGSYALVQNKQDNYRQYDPHTNSYLLVCAFIHKLFPLFKHPSRQPFEPMHIFPIRRRSRDDREEHYEQRKRSTQKHTAASHRLFHFLKA